MTVLLGNFGRIFFHISRAHYFSLFAAIPSKMHLTSYPIVLIGYLHVQSALTSIIMDQYVLPLPILRFSMSTYSPRSWKLIYQK